MSALCSADFFFDREEVTQKKAQKYEIVDITRHWIKRSLYLVIGRLLAFHQKVQEPHGLHFTQICLGLIRMGSVKIIWSVHFDTLVAAFSTAHKHHSRTEIEQAHNGSKSIITQFRAQHQRCGISTLWSFGFRLLCGAGSTKRAATSLEHGPQCETCANEMPLNGLYAYL